MRSIELPRAMLAAALALGCAASEPDAPVDFGRRPLATLEEPCEGIAGLTGQAVLDQRFDHVTATLGHVSGISAGSAQVNPEDVTTLTVDLTWPAAPVAVCYPEATARHWITGPRVAIEGLTIRFATTDGKFAEVLPASAWRRTDFRDSTWIAASSPSSFVLAATSRDALSGSWTPFPGRDSGWTTLAFDTRTGASPTDVYGNVSLTEAPLAEVAAGIVDPGIILALWPFAP